MLVQTFTDCLNILSTVLNPWHVSWQKCVYILYVYTRIFCSFLIRIHTNIHYSNDNQNLKMFFFANICYPCGILWRFKRTKSIHSIVFIAKSNAGKTMKLSRTSQWCPLWMLKLAHQRQLTHSHGSVIII